jgi:hypothetical protein
MKKKANSAAAKRKEDGKDEPSDVPVVQEAVHLYL